MTEANVTLVYVRYLDHVLFSRCSPLVMKPQLREAVGWLNYECEDYIVLSWDRDADPPSLKGGDPKASGLVLLKSDTLEIKKLEAKALPLQNNCYCHLNSVTSNSSSEYAPDQRSEKLSPETKTGKDKKQCKR
jgi:hypothetical protein